MKEEITGSTDLKDVDTASLDVKPEAADLSGSTSQAVIEEVPAQPRRSRRLAKPEIVKDENETIKDTKSAQTSKETESTRVLTEEEVAQGMLLKPLLIQGSFFLPPSDYDALITKCIVRQYQSEFVMIYGRCSLP